MLVTFHENWAETIAKSLKLGGKIHLVEFHPCLDVKFGYDYFYNDVPDIEEESTYSENAGEAKQTIAVWAPPISDLVNALISAGIKIYELHEFPYSPYPCFDNMNEVAKNQFILDEQSLWFPLIYSLMGTKKIMTFNYLTGVLLIHTVW